MSCPSPECVQYVARHMLTSAQPACCATRYNIDTTVSYSISGGDSKSAPTIVTPLVGQQNPCISQLHNGLTHIARGSSGRSSTRARMRQILSIYFSFRWWFSCFKHHVFPSSPRADHPRRSHRNTVCIFANACAPLTVVAQNALALKVKLLALHQQTTDRNTFALLIAILVAIVGSFCHNGAFLNNKTHTLTSANQAFVFCPSR